ncbi:MAG TPA: hypothetical protein GX520_01515 [Syntrophaceticus sp.]|nr:hypothetical protein [Syntrophaceticus sp.]
MDDKTKSIYNILPQIVPATPSTAGQVSPPESLLITPFFMAPGHNHQDRMGGTWQGDIKSI